MTKESESLASDPIIIQGNAVERSEREKYLGMFLDARGVRETVEEQMQFRIKECEGKMVRIRQL